MSDPVRFDNDDPVGEALLLDYLAEHSLAYRYDADTSTVLIGFAHGDHVPDLPDETNLPYSGADLGEATLCAFCDTPVRHVDGAGWRHTASFADRDGCVNVFPR